jgi:hypothetical protein
MAALSAAEIRFLLTVVGVGDADCLLIMTFDLILMLPVLAFFIGFSAFDIGAAAGFGVGVGEGSVANEPVDATRNKKPGAIKRIVMRFIRPPYGHCGAIPIQSRTLPARKTH